MKARIPESDQSKFDRVISSCIDYYYQAYVANENRCVIKYDSKASEVENKFVYQVAILLQNLLPHTNMEAFPIYFDGSFKEFRKFKKKFKSNKIKKLLRKNNYMSITVSYLKVLIKNDFRELYTDDLLEKICKEFWGE